MAYTPELADQTSSTLRRIAWSLNRPMTKTMEWIFTDLVKFIPSGAIARRAKTKRNARNVHLTRKENQQ